MRSPEEILLRPLLTEKRLQQQEELGHHAFEVARDANKIEIKRAVEEKFDVVVEDVRTMLVKGKAKRMNTRRGLTEGRRRSWKKAIVALREGDTIDFFEGR